MSRAGHPFKTAKKIKLIKGPVNSIISSAWPNQTYSHKLSYWLIVCGYKVSANRRAVSLSALASFQYTTTTNYTNDRALSRIKYEYSLRDWAVPHTGLECLFPINYNSGHRWVDESDLLFSTSWPGLLKILTASCDCLVRASLNLPVISILNLTFSFWLLVIMCLYSALFQRFIL